MECLGFGFKTTEINILFAIATVFWETIFLTINGFSGLYLHPQALPLTSDWVSWTYKCNIVKDIKDQDCSSQGERKRNMASCQTS